MGYDAQKDGLESYNFAISCKRKSLLMERAWGCAERVEVIGDSELYQGDCLEVMSTLPDASVDMVMCDLPYGTTQNKWDSIIPLDKLWAEYWRVVKPSGAVVLTASQPFTTKLAASNLEYFRYSLVWNKVRPVGHLNAKRRPMQLHEDILIFCRNPPPYNPQGLIPCKKINRRSTSGENYGKSGLSNVSEWTNYPVSILEFGSDQSGKVHPTQKPVALMEYLIRTYTNEGETVLDNTMGSGTTGVACKNTGRRFIGIERDPNYFQIAKDRIAKASP
jgi:site-specific DNA-methyltransferase (adenine-specific)